MLSLRTGQTAFRAGTRGATRVAAMVDLAARVEELRALESDAGASDGEIRRAIGALADAYHGFAETFGRVTQRANRRAYDERNLGYANLLRLERLDENGEFAGEGTMLSERVIFPAREPVDRVGDAKSALAASLDQTGVVDLGVVGGLLGLPRESALEALGDLVVEDPDSGRVVPAGDYLSGNVRQKLAHVRDLLRGERDLPVQAALARFHRDEGIADVAAMRNRYELGEDVVAHLKGSGAWELMVDPYSATTAAPVLGDIYPTVMRNRRRSAAGRVTTAVAYLTDLKDDSEFDTMAYLGGHSATERATNPQAPLASIRGVVASFPNMSIRSWRLNGTQVTETARFSYAALCGAFASNGGRPSGYVAHLVKGGADSHAYGRYASAVCRLAGIGEIGASGLAARESVTPQQIEDAIVGSPEVAEFLLERTVAWLSMDAVDRAGVSGPGRDLVESALSPQFASQELFEAYCARRRDAVAAARAGINRRRVARLEQLEAQLERALPAPIDRRDISLNLGSPWIPAKVVLDFLVEKVVDPSSTAHGLSELSVSNDPVTGEWDLHWGGCRARAAAMERYGVSGDGINPLTPFAVASAAMRNGGVRVTRRGARGRQAVDEDMSLLAWDKRATMEADFASWAWSEPRRARLLERCYNETVNGVVPLSVDGSYLTLPDASPAIGLLPHQKNGVARILRSDEGTLLAHAVGAGKTYEGIVACHEAKRLGRAAKPLVAVPNGIVGQWESSWAELYPNDNVLVMTSAWTRDADSRERFWRTAAEGEWDGIVVPHSRFDELRLGADATRELGRRRYERADAAARQAAGTPLQARRDRMASAALRAMGRDLSESGDGVTFDALGVDMLVVDEAHAYKNLDVGSSMGVAGVPSGSSRRARSLLLRCDWMRAQGHAPNIVFLTGTPVTNSMSELYVMQRYLAPATLRSQGFATFDQWALNYGRVSREVEVRPEGGLQVKDRFSRFANLPELMASTRTFCDLVTNEDLGLDLPEVRVVNVEVPARPAQEMCMRWLAGRGDRVRHDLVSPTVDNLLSIINDGRKVAIDPKLLFPDDGDVRDLGEGGKISRCAEQVAEVWRRTTTDPDGNEVRGVQLVFCDASTAASGAAWDAQGALVARLVRLGIPLGEIEVLSGKTSVTAREAAFERARSGAARVLIGSTTTLGTGVSVQRRLAAIHDLDCPWRSSDLEQRMGRIRRQGNTFAGCAWWQPVDYRYATVGTFDSFLYQTAERKAHFIGQVMSNANPLREVPDLTEEVLTLSEMKAIVSGDPRVRERLELENEVNALRRRRSAWSRETEQAQRSLVEDVRPRIDTEEHLTGGLRALAEPLARAASLLEEAEGPWAGMRIGETEYPPTAQGLNDANEALAGAVAGAREDDGRTTVGSILGLDLAVVWRESIYGTLGQTRPHFELSRTEGGRVTSSMPCRGTGPTGGPVAQVLETIEASSHKARQAERTMLRLRAQEEELERRSHERWPLERELAEKAARLEAMPVRTRSAVEQHPPTEQDVHDFLCGNALAGRPDRDAQAHRPVRHRVLLESQAESSSLDARPTASRAMGA